MDNSKNGILKQKTPKNEMDNSKWIHQNMPIFKQQNIIFLGT